MAICIQTLCKMGILRTLGIIAMCAIMESAHGFRCFRTLNRTLEGMYPLRCRW